MSSGTRGREVRGSRPLRWWGPAALAIAEAGCHPPQESISAGEELEGGLVCINGPTRVDIGRVREPDVVRTRFVFENRGTSVLSLAAPRQSCTCTSAHLGDRELAPGEQSELDVSILTRGMNGPREAAVWLVDDVGGSVLASVTIQFDVEPSTFIWLEPDRIALTLGGAEPVEHGELDLVVRGIDPDALPTLSGDEWVGTEGATLNIAGPALHRRVGRHT